MPTVFHTADVHLTPAHPERTAALEAVLDRAAEHGADVVTIGGDLFDRPEDVETLRPDLRNRIFTDRPFRILLIPGNHDVAAYRGDVFFGDACTVLDGEPFEHWTSPDGSLRITGLPYTERPDEELLIALQDRAPFEGTDVLLLHCSLDAPFAGDESGDEGGRRYFPVTEELLSELGFDYYLAGHYHSPHTVSLPDGATFTYPGTPASTRQSETGPRRVSRLDPATGIEFVPLETFHYAARTFTVTPGDEQALLDEVRAWADQHAIDAAEASVQVDGFVETGETTFADRLAEAAAPADVVDDTRDVQHVLSRPLFRSFEAELDRTAWDDETKRQVWERTVEVFNQLAVGGEL